MQFLRKSTAAQTRTIGPFVDDTDAKTAETALTIANTDIKLMANGGSSANKNSGGATHRANGHYAITLDDTDTATVGELTVSVSVAGALPVWAKFYVLTEAVFDAMFGASAAGPTASLGTNAPAGWINAAAIAPSALNGKGDWATAGDEMALTSAERSTLAGVIDSRLLDDGDATDLIAGIVARLGTVDIDETSLVAALKAALFDAADITNKLRVDSSGRVTVGSNADKTGYSLVTAPLDATGIRNAVGLTSANIDTQLSGILGRTWTDTERAQIRYLLGVDGTASAPVSAVGNLRVMLRPSVVIDANTPIVTEGLSFAVTARDDFENDGEIGPIGPIRVETDLPLLRPTNPPRLRFGATQRLGSRLGAVKFIGSAYAEAVVGQSDQFDIYIELTREELNRVPGTYSWDVEAVFPDGDVRTIVDGTLTLKASMGDNEERDPLLTP